MAGEAAFRCSFCGRTKDAVVKLISSPSDFPRAYICDDCVRTCINSLQGPTGECSFCHKGSDEVRLVASSGDPPKALICEECLMVCMLVIEDDTPALE